MSHRISRSTLSRATEMQRVEYAAALAEYRRTHRPILDDPRLVVCPLECDQRPPPRGLNCQSRCTNASCPLRGKDQPLIPWLRRLLRVVHGLMPVHPPPLPISKRRRLLLITITYPHAEQLLRLRHCQAAIADEPDVLWIVVEDSAEPSTTVATLLARGTVRYIHVAHGPTRRLGNAQRNVALKLIRDRRLEGVVYNLDDDNGYHPRLWNELRVLEPRRVGVLAVRRGVYPPPRCDGHFLPLVNRQQRTLKIERPIYENGTGQFVGFEAGWCRKRSWMTRRYGKRKYCVDMAGFAFDAALLHGLRGDLWEYEGHGGESELIERLLGTNATPHDLQPLAGCGQDVLVFHNEWRIVPMAMIHRPPSTARCGQRAR